MFDKQFWSAERDGQLSAVVGSLRLLVRSSDDCARFLIVHQSTHDNSYSNLLASGTESNVNAAMAAARKAATRIEYILADRLKGSIGHDDLGQGARPTPR